MWHCVQLSASPPQRITAELIKI